MRRHDPEGRETARAPALRAREPHELAARAPRALLLLLCLFSSAFDLVCEIAWGRTLGLVFGVTVFAVSAVLAAFMLGLALGGFAARRLLARWSGSPIVLYARLHAGIALAAAATLLAIPAIRTLYLAASQALGADAWALRPVVLVLSFVLLIVPTTLMGATFPVASQVLSPPPERVGREIGWLYAAGTVGSVLGCVATIFVLLPAAGLRGTLGIAALAYLAVALAASKLGPFAIPASVASTKIPRRALALAAWLGAQTLACEILCTRVLTFFVDTSIRSFALMLTVFLCGLSAGSALVSRRLDSTRDPTLLLGRIEVAIGMSSIVAIPILAHLSAVVAWLDAHVGASWRAEAGARFLAFSLALLLPTALMGSAFPVIAKIATGGGAPLGPAVSRVYGANTAGGVVGSLVAGFVLLPWLGVGKSLVLVSLTSAAVGVALLMASPLPRSSKAGEAVGCVALFAAVLGTAGPDGLRAIYTERYPPESHELVYLGENVNGTTAVFRDLKHPGAPARLYLVINGRGEVSTDYFSMRAFRFLGLLPAFYVKEPDRALIVTFGSGIVAGSIAGLPEVKDADCVEICAEAFGAAHFFAAENHDVLANPKISFRVNDGRNYLLTTRKRYDILSADATHPTSGDSWILYTKEFYELCAARLNDGGVMSQWIPMHGVSEGDFKTLLKTFHSAFPFVAVYYAGGFKAAGHVVLLGSKSPLRIDVHHAEALFANDRVRDDLARVNVLSLPDLFNGFIFDQSAVDAFTGNAPLNTDDDPVVAFSTPEAGPAPSSWLSSIAKYRMSVYPELAGMDPEMAAGVERGLAASFEATGYAIQAQVLEAKEYAARGALDLDRPGEGTREGLERSLTLFGEVIADYDRALRTNPQDAHTTYLRTHAAAELRSLQGLLQREPAMAHDR
jgi:spermidine synthase